MKRFKDWWDKAGDKGFKIPFIIDPVTKKPSITIMFPYITFVMAMGSLLWLHFDAKQIVATGATFMFWVTSTVLYMIRKINKAKFDFDDGKVELQNDKGDE